MKTYKQIDFYGSIVLIMGSLVAGLIAANEYSLLGYFIVGGWQLVSMLIHEATGWFIEAGSKRRRYHFWVLGFICITLLGLLVYPVLMLVLFVLLFAAPCMAIYYTCICYAEIQQITSRPLAQLK